MSKGSLDLLILLIIFLGLQAWWIYPIFKRNKQTDKNNTVLKNIKTLERLYNR